MSKRLRILIVDDDRRMARTLLDILRVKGFEAEAVFSGREALERIRKTPFDCVMTDIKMPEMDGVDLVKAAREIRNDLPVLLMTAYSVQELIQEGLRHGATAAVTKPLDMNGLLGFFSALRRTRSVLIVDDDPTFARTLGDILRLRGFSVSQVTDPHSVTDVIQSEKQVVCLDMKLNSINGLDVLKRIKKHSPNIPVILVTWFRQEMSSLIEKALKHGAHTCLYKPIEIDALCRTLREIRDLEVNDVVSRHLRR